MLKSEIGSALKSRRKELKITQPRLAELAGISVNTLYKLERGAGNPTIDVLYGLAEVLGIEIILQVKKKY